MDYYRKRLQTEGLREELLKFWRFFGSLGMLRKHCIRAGNPHLEKVSLCDGAVHAPKAII